MSQNRQTALRVDLALTVPAQGYASDHRDGERIPDHSHDAAQLIHAAAGVMTIETDEGLWVVPPQRAVWVPASTPHAIRMTGNVALRTVYIAPECAPIEGGCCVVQVSALLRAAILRVVDYETPYPSEGPEARLVATLLDEIRAAPVVPFHLSLPRDPAARRVAEALQTDPSDPRSIAAWARFAGASERTLERRFRDELGLPFGAWRQQARLLRALELLAAGRSVTQTALDVGFETPSAFIAMFRRALGTTPAQYFRVSGTRRRDD